MILISSFNVFFFEISKNLLDIVQVDIAKTKLICTSVFATTKL